MKIPSVNLKAQYEPLRAEVLSAISRVIDSQGFILGAEVKALEEEVARYSGARHGIGCASGSDALLLALMALDVKAGDEVIAPSFTFFATGGAIARLGARPVLVEIRPDTYTIDPEPIEAAITAKTRAIIPVHMYGHCADMDPILEIGRRHNLPVIEDAAQAIGAKDQGRRAGTMGRIGCFSFYPTKNLGAAGDAGMLLTDDEALAARLRRLRVHGGETEYFHDEVGINSRLDAMQAAILRVKLPHLDAWAEGRNQKAQYYDRLFASTSLPYQVTTPFIRSGANHVFHQYVVRVPRPLRDPLMAHLGECGVGTRIYYPVPLHRQACFAYLGYREGDLPQCEAAALETLAIPLYSELSDQEQQYVVDCFRSFNPRR
jgi:dTDP-4-amino-4,6-dideoxygalactose transaminase